MARERVANRHHCGCLDPGGARDPDRRGPARARRLGARGARGRGGRPLRAAAGARAHGRGARSDAAGAHGDAPDDLAVSAPLARRSVRETRVPMSFVSHVECTICGAHHDAKRLLTVCEKCGQMLAVRYDLARAAASLTTPALPQRAAGVYRVRELTPLDDAEQPVTLGEGGTPLLELPRLAAHFGIRKIWGKDEGQNPTGCFKAGGLGMGAPPRTQA